MHARYARVWAALFLLVGCGSNEGPPTANTAPTARADAGEDATPAPTPPGGDARPAVPQGPPAQAAVALNKTSVSGCFNIATGALSEPPTPENYIAIMNPNVPPPGDIRVVDGESDAEVTCRVSGDGSITGRLVTSRLTFDVNGTASGGTGTATISEWDTTSQVTLTGDNCALNVKSLSPGAVWSQFNCADFSNGAIVCSVQGAFVFENCAE